MCLELRELAEGGASGLTSEARRGAHAARCAQRSASLTLTLTLSLTPALAPALALALTLTQPLPHLNPTLTTLTLTLTLTRTLTLTLTPTAQERESHSRARAAPLGREPSPSYMVHPAFSPRVRELESGLRFERQVGYGQARLPGQVRGPTRP